MHRAKAGEGDHLGLLIAPPRQGGGPLARTAQRVHLLTDLDHAAVDHAGHQRRQLARGDGDHRFVQQREALPDLPLLHANPPLQVADAGDQVRIPAALADRGGLSRGRVCSLAVAGGKVLLHDRQQQIAALGAFVLLVFQQPLGARDPAGRRPHLATKEKAEAQPECATDGAPAFTGIQVRLMGTFKRLQIVVVPADQIRRHGQQLEILAAQSGCLIGCRERAVGIGPGPPLVALTAPFEFAAHARAAAVGAALIEVAHLRRSVAGEPNRSRADPAGFQRSALSVSAARGRRRPSRSQNAIDMLSRFRRCR